MGWFGDPGRRLTGFRVHFLGLVGLVLPFLHFSSTCLTTIIITLQILLATLILRTRKKVTFIMRV